MLTIKEKVRFIILISTFHLPGFLMAQILVSHDVSIVITSSAIVNVNGGTNFSGGELINDGILQITKNSIFPNPGDFKISDSNNTSGNGFYKIEQDWINNAFFECSNSTVELYGNTEQFITNVFISTLHPPHTRLIRRGPIQGRKFVFFQPTKGLVFG